MSRDRRRFPRYVTSGISGRLATSEPFEAVRVSRGGMLVRVDREPELSERIGGQLEVLGDVFPFDAEVVFVGPDLGAQQVSTYRVGLAFVDFPSQRSDHLERLVAERFPAE